MTGLKRNNNVYKIILGHMSDKEENFNSIHHLQKSTIIHFMGSSWSCSLFGLASRSCTVETKITRIDIKLFNEEKYSICVCVYIHIHISNYSGIL